MDKDIWISPDNYHMEDLLALGRCIVCGQMAGGDYDETVTFGTESYRVHFDHCKHQLEKCIAALKAKSV